METKTDIEILRYIYPWNVQTYDFTFCSIMIMRVFPLRLHNFCVCSFFFIIKTNQYTFYINFIQLFNISFSPYPLGTMHAKSMQLSYLQSMIQDCLINWFWEDIIARTTWCIFILAWGGRPVQTSVPIILWIHS